MERKIYHRYLTRFLIFLLSLALLTSLNTVPSSAAGLAADDDDFLFGVCGHPMEHSSGTYRMATLEEQIHLVAELGVKLYRVDANLKDLTTLDFMDKCIDLCRAYGLEVMLVIYDEDKAEMCASRYKGKIKYYQILNERDAQCINTDAAGNAPDGTQISHYDPEKLVEVARQMKNIIAGVRKGDPNAEILINATWTHYGFVEAMLNYGVEFDLLGWDWYSNMDHYGLDNLLDDLSRFDKDIIFCELNIWTKTEPQSAMAGYLAERLYTLYELKNSERIVGACIYELLDEPNHSVASEGQFGLVSVDKSLNNFEPKQAYKAVQQLLGGGSRTKILLSDLQSSPTTTMDQVTTQPAETTRSNITTNRTQSGTKPSSGTTATTETNETADESTSLSASTFTETVSTPASTFTTGPLPTDTEPHGLSTGWIIVIVVACILVLAGGGIALYFFVFKKKSPPPQ